MSLANMKLLLQCLLKGFSSETGMEKVILKMEGEKPDYFTFFPQFFNSSWMVPTFLPQVWAPVQEGREGKWEITPNRTQQPLGPVPPREGDVWVATLGQTGSDQFLCVPLCSWTASRGGPGTKKHLP